MKTGEGARLNQTRFCDELGISSNQLVFTRYNFRNGIATPTQRDGGKTFSGVDAMVTASPGIFLFGSVADCLLLFAFDPHARIVGLAHLSWHNLVKEFTLEFIEKIISLGSDVNNLVVGISPSIGPCHFQVDQPGYGQSVFDKFSHYPTARIKKGGRLYIDLWEVATIQILRTGVLKKNLENPRVCTYCFKQEYFSYRRDFYGKSNFPTMAGIIGRKK